ncbi:MAG: hypothetical protein ACI9WL_001410 [Rubritalea sp.]|jgi:hypothetical protein
MVFEIGKKKEVKLIVLPPKTKQTKFLIHHIGKGRLYHMIGDKSIRTTF